jgi:hypothetical protein
LKLQTKKKPPEGDVGNPGVILEGGNPKSGSINPLLGSVVLQLLNLLSLQLPSSELAVLHEVSTAREAGRGRT